MEFNPYSIPLIISLTAIFTIGLMTFRHNPSSPINKSFFYFCLSLCFWLFTFAIMYNCKNEAWGLFSVRLGFLSVPFISILAYYFVNQLLYINPVPHFRKLLAFAILSLPLFNTNLIYSGIKQEFWGPYPIAGKIYFIYMIFFGTLFLCCVKMLFSHMQKMTDPKDKYKHQEIKYVLLAFVIGSTGLIDFIAKYPVRIYPIGWLSALLFIALIGYAILKHQSQENELLREEVTQTERFKAIAALTSGIVHQIKNPLAILQSFNEHLAVKKDDPEFIKRYQTLVPKEINRINNLLQDLLALGKPSPPVLEPIDPHKIINEVINLTSLQNEYVKIQKVFDPQEAILQADQQQLKQALLNITLNAIDAMPHGGTLAIKTFTIPLPTKIIPSKKGIFLIEISDTGCGIDPIDLPHIFEPFYTKKERGTGLGLAITQGIIEKHGGEIAVESVLNKGTKFQIEIPIYELPFS